MCQSCNCNTASVSATPKADKVKNFIQPGGPRYTWRTLPAIALGIGGSLQDVLDGLKQDPEGFEVRLGIRGDLYVKVAD